MSDTGQNRFEIDLDEIERQLRRSADLGPTTNTPQNDPLAELARIVGQDDPFLNILGDPRKQEKARERQEPTFDAAEREAAPAPARPAPRNQADAALSAEDRDVLGTGPARRNEAEAAPQADAFDPVAGSYGEAGAMAADDFTPMPPPRSRRRIGAVMALVALTAVGAAGAFTWRKMGGSTPSGPPPLIKADNAPLKVAPENPGGMDIPNQDRQIYEGKVESGRSRVLDRQEQPIDVREAARQMQPAEPPPPVPSPAPVPAAEPQVNGQVATASPTVPTVPREPETTPGSATPGTAAPAPAPQRSAAWSALGEPRRVRTVAVRPDGTAIGAAGGLMVSDPNAPILPSGQVPPPVTRPTVSIPLNGTAAPQPQAQPAPAPAPAPTAAAAPAPVPTADPPAPPPSVTPSTDGATPPTTATPVRVLPPQRPRNLAASASPAPAAAEPVTTAAAAPGGGVSSLFPFNFGGGSEPVRAQEPAPGTRTYAVQLAVRPTEAAARTAYDQLADKYPTELGGKPATVTEAKVNGRSVFRIRVTPLTREAANDLCTRLKASGGQCYVVAN